MPDEDKSLRARVEKLARRRARCWICDAEIETGTLVDAHLRTTHPEYVEWSRRQRKWPRLIVGSFAAFVLLDALYLRSLKSDFVDIGIAFFLATFFLWMVLVGRQRRTFRNAWKESHPALNLMIWMLENAPRRKWNQKRHPSTLHSLTASLML